MLAGIAFDPTNALPLKFTTWLERLRYTTNVSRNVGSVKKVALAVRDWFAVTEPELRLDRMIRGAETAISHGADPATIREALLSEIAGIKTKSARDVAIEKFAVQQGLLDKGISVHQVISLVEESLVTRAQKLQGLYHSVSDQIRELEKIREAEAAAEKLHKMTVAKQIDQASEALNQAAKKTAEAGAARSSASRSATEAKIAARTAREQARVSTKVVKIADVGVHVNPVVAKAVKISVAGVHTNPVVAKIVAEDIAKPRVALPATHVQAHTAYSVFSGDSGSVTVHGAQFPKGQATTDFLKSPEFKSLDEKLNSTLSNGKPDISKRGIAQGELNQASSAMQAEAVRLAEGGDTRLLNGQINWNSGMNKKGVLQNWDTVSRGRRSADQHLAAASDLAARAGAGSESEARQIFNDRIIFEKTKRDFAKYRKMLVDGKLTPEAYKKKVDELRAIGLVRDSARLGEDLSIHGSGVLRTLDASELMDDIRVLHIGDQLVNDLLTAEGIDMGVFKSYYEAMSLLPSNMAGPGLQTELMALIMDPTTRGTITRAKLRSILLSAPFAAHNLTPVSFRNNAQHLFALFHMTLLAGDIKLLEGFSKTVQTVLVNDPQNIMARMWNVMEARAGLPYARRFRDLVDPAKSFRVLEAGVEDDFVRSLLANSSLGHNIHPNLALGMISYGPLARILPTRHGLSRLMAPLMESKSKLVAAATANWDDGMVLDNIAKMANGELRPAAAIRKASQMIHYIAIRYGDTFRRAAFMTDAFDASIANWFKNGPTGPAWKQFEQAYAEISRKASQAWHDTDAVPLLEFQSELLHAFNKEVKGGQRFTPEIRQAFDELYWKGVLPHDNPGLHTYMFYAKLQQPGIEVGQQYADYGLTYLHYMQDAGFAAEAREIIATIFPAQRASSAAHAYEKIYGFGMGLQPNLSNADRLFLEADLLPTFERASVTARTRRAVEIADEERKVMREMGLDVNARIADTNPLAYAGADFSSRAEAIVGAVEELKALAVRAEQVAKSHPGVSETSIQNAMKSARQAAKRTGQVGARRALSGLERFGVDVARHARVRLARSSLQTRIVSELGGLVRATTDVHALPADAMEQLENAVTALRGIPEMKSVLDQLASIQGNDLWASRLGDFLKNEAWYKNQMADDVAKKAAPALTVPPTADELNSLAQKAAPARTVPPTADELNVLAAEPASVQDALAALAPVPVTASAAARDSMSQQALLILSGMSEENWLKRELYRAERRFNLAGTRAERKIARGRMEDARKGLKVIEVRRTGGSYIPFSVVKVHVDRVVSAGLDRAHAVMNPHHLSPFVTGQGGALVERGRAEYRIWSTAPAAESGTVAPSRAPGVNFNQHGAAIHAAIDVPVTKSVLTRFGFPEADFGSLTTLQIVNGLDEFQYALKDARFRDFADYLVVKMNSKIRRITGDDTYTLTHYLQERLTSTKNYYDVASHDAHDLIVADAISAARDGARRVGSTDLRRPSGVRPENPLTELLDQDVRAVIGKNKALAQLGVDPHAYNEARKVLRPARERYKQASFLLRDAEDSAADILHKRGFASDSSEFKAAWSEVYDAEFLRIRYDRLRVEAGTKLAELAREMPGARVEDVIAEFENRYTMSADVKGFEPSPITEFQRETLKNAIQIHLNIADITDPAQVREGLGRFGQNPPFESRAKMREWLQKYGVWSPRTSEQIELGKQSWSIFDEAKYYESNFGFVPDWARPDLLEPGGDLHLMLHDEELYTGFMLKWGVFSKNLEGRFAVGAENLTREQLVQRIVHGDEALGINAKRDLALERRFVFERFGTLASPDGKTLTAFPWLMHRDEIRSYVIARGKAAIAKDLVQTTEELNILTQLIDLHVGRHFDETIMAGKIVTYEDMFTVAATITHDMLLNPIWIKQGKAGKVLRKWAAFQRALVFTQIGFATTNVIDTGIKGPLSAFRTRAFRSGADLSNVAYGLTLAGLGIDRISSLLKDVPVHGIERIKHAALGPGRYVVNVSGKVISETPLQRSVRGILEVAVGVTELSASVAKTAEDFAKLRLAQGMWDGVYARALARTKDAGLADAITRKFVAQEVSRLWPTVGDGVLERFFNQLSPFLTYQFKNRVLFIGELMNHPGIFNHLNRIGDAIEKANRERWAVEHPGEELEPNLARMIELPWAPGTFIDIGSFSDASRGLKPLYVMAGKGEMTVRDFTALWVRAVSPSTQNIVGSILNNLNLMPHYGWKPILDKQGYATGKYERVVVPWQAPWGGTADWTNSIWPWELWNGFQKASGGGLTVQEATVLGAQMLTFGGVYLHDRGKGLNLYFWALQDKNPAAAKAFLLTPDGIALKTYWLDLASTRVQEAVTPELVDQILNPKAGDPNPWFHAQSAEFQAKIKSDLDALAVIGDKWDQIIGHLLPGTPEFKAARLQAATERYEFIASHPEFYDYTVFSKTPSEWARTLEKWHVDDMVQTYYDMKSPSRSDFATVAAYQAARADWNVARDAYLKAFPQVAERIGAARAGVEGVWQQTEKSWFEILEQIGTRSIAIDAARQSKDYDTLDQLYLLNELDHNRLGEDQIVSYFDPISDFNTIPGGGKGPAQIKSGPFGQDLLPRVKILPDFNAWWFSRMTLEEKAKFERDTRYAEGMKTIISAAKSSKNFGLTFVTELKKNAFLLNQYFNRNPGKREQWASNDQYIKAMGGYGALIKKGDFTGADRYFSRLPDWMKARYYAKHPDRKKAQVENMQYMSLMEKWTAFYRQRDYAGGAAFFAKLPQWVKDRYYGAHPSNNFSGSSPYSKAMGQWVKLLQSGKKDEAKAYFDQLPQAFKDRYYAKHPDQKLKNDIKRTGQLGQYFAANDAGRAQFLTDNPEFAMWLKANDTSQSKERSLILAAYNALPKNDQWLRRVFREKYPEIFSPEAKGNQSLQNTYSFLSDHPDMLPDFERWVKAVWDSYAEEIKHTLAKPKPVLFEHFPSHGTKRKTRKHGSYSAAWVRLHSV